MSLEPVTRPSNPGKYQGDEYIPKAATDDARCGTDVGPACRFRVSFLRLPWSIKPVTTLGVVARVMSLSHPPKALLTDVFGTVVDWRKTVVTYLQSRVQESPDHPSNSLGSSIRDKALNVSWPAFAQQWRNSYYHYTSNYNPDKDAWKSIDEHHDDSLHVLLKEHGLEGFWSDREVREISLIWHHLDPWPDSAAGLDLLNQNFETSTLSNGNQSLLTDLTAHGHLPYKHIISAEDFKRYKPHPDVYRGACQKLGLAEGECALIAAHLGDLEGAKKVGLQTIYVERRDEEAWGVEKTRKAKEAGWVDMWIGVEQDGLREVAHRFGCTAPASEVT